MRYRAYAKLLNWFVLMIISVEMLVRPAMWFLSHVDVALANFLKHSIEQYNNNVLKTSKLLFLSATKKGILKSPVPFRMP